jgi:hypothetical protein
MGDFLRDQGILFLTIQEVDLELINSDLQEVLAKSNSAGDPAVLSYLLRYDGLGIIRTGFEEIKRSFGIAKNIDRVIFQLKSRSKSVEVKIDKGDRNNCLLVVSDNDEAWVDSTFRRLSSRIKQFQNRNGFMHSLPVEFAIQISGVLVGFALCLIVAQSISSCLNFRYSFFVAFVGLFLLFSNVWTYVLILLGRLRIFLWPFISFKKKPLGLIGQTVIATIVAAALTFLGQTSWRILTRVGFVVQDQLETAPSNKSLQPTLPREPGGSK